MFQADCLCKKKSKFKKSIVYKNETVFYRFEGTVIARCINCRLLKTFPSVKNMQYDPEQSRFEMYEGKKDFFWELFQPIVSLIKKNNTGKHVLDIGCSSGILMELLEEKGYEVEGIEPNEEAYKIASKRFGNKVFHGTSKDFSSKSGIFDVVIFNHVLEHIEDVHAELERAKKLLKSGGLLIVGIPNTRNFIFSIRGKYWEPLMPNEHVWHFSDHYMQNLVHKHGFKVNTMVYADDKRQEYPLLKKIYFTCLSKVNTLFQTGESVLIGAVKQ